jgi:hypothetical protein
MALTFQMERDDHEPKSLCSSPLPCCKQLARNRWVRWVRAGNRQGLRQETPHFRFQPCPATRMCLPAFHLHLDRDSPGQILPTPPSLPRPAEPPRKQACAEKAQPNNRLHLYTCSNTTLPWFYRRAIAFGPASLSLCFSFALLQSPTRCPAQRKQTRPVTAVAGSHRRTSPPRVTLSRLATSTNLNVISLKRL